MRLDDGAADREAEADAGCRALLAATLEHLEMQLGDDHDQVLLLLDTSPGMAQSKIAEALGWVSEYGPLKQKVNRALARLVKHHLADKDSRGKYRITKKGKQDAKRLHEAA